MTVDMADDMLVDTSLSTPEPSSSAKELGTTTSTPPLPSTDNDVEPPSIQLPDEAALAAAAAAMAAAAQGQAEAVDQQQQQTTDHALGASDDLNSYLLAAAAASVHAQQQHLSDDQQKAQSERSFDTANGSISNSIHANDTSINGSDMDDAPRAATIQGQCQKYIDDRTPFPLTIGKRTPGGVAELLASTNGGQHASQGLDGLPFTQAKVELGKTRCYWALLSADHSQGSGPTGEKLEFVYLDPILQQHMAEQAGKMVGSDFYDYVHPEERDRVSDDMQKIVESRTLFGSVTRCRYSRIPHIRELLGASNPPRDPEADRYVEDDSFVAIDFIVNWIGDGMLLCFFHAIIDKAAEDNDEQHKSDWTNWCGTPGGSFTLRQCDTIWKQVKAVPRETIPDSGPDHIFQVIEAGEDGRVLLSWPPPRLFSGHVEANLLAQSDTTVFQDGSYFADDFAQLAQGVSIAPGSSSLSDANTSCTRRFRAKHTLTTEGKVRSIESVLIPYGGVILACFHTTFQQELSPPVQKLVLQAGATVQAQAERRKAEDSQISSNKRQRTDDGPVTISKPQTTLPQSKAGTSASASTSSTLKAHASAADNGHHAQTNGHSTKTANGSTPKPAVSKYQKPAMKSEASGLAALANPSLMYTNAPIKTPATPTSTAAARPNSDRNPSTPAQKAANGRLNHVASPSPATASSATAGSPGASPNKACTGCGKINSPEWRRGPSGHKTLCNACGLRYARSLTRRKKKKGKDGEVEFIEPTGDPSVVPKSRGGGGGSLPGVHRKNSKKRKEEEAAKVAAAAAANAAMAASAGNATASASPSASSSSASATQSPAAVTAPAAKAEPPAQVRVASPAATTSMKVESVEGDVSASPAASTSVKTESVEGVPESGSISQPAPGAVGNDKEASATALTPAAPTDPATDPSHSIAVSIALGAIAQATSSARLIDTDPLPLPVSNAISRAIAATIGSTDISTALPTADLHPPGSILSTEPSTTHDAASAAVDLDPAVSAAALQTIESVVSEALYKQLVHSSLPETPTADAHVEDKGERQVDLTDALTADAIRAAAQAAVAQGVAEE
ncbi:uncharacterized protein SPSC_03977 [Sporisorium scitamineum]|uniref:GATA-type domain-containing protein n=1 Tax=Sporisorium scitamineum TaxID=49012 RepID=A0A0F7RWG0_9BASI|nr:hypothetical protein [Sporisorium scitamineum]CDU24476.1 uncharacterized protein SPSC_03977 [Sporisorium scitamineum]